MLTAAQQATFDAGRAAEDELIAELVEAGSLPSGFVCRVGTRLRSNSQGHAPCRQRET